MLVGVRTVGLGGTILVRFACSGCENHLLVFQNSVLLEQIQHTRIGFALQVAFVAAGCMHSQYHKVLSLSWHELLQPQFILYKHQTNKQACSRVGL